MRWEEMIPSIKYDVTVVGGGVMGAATSLSLAQWGLSVVNFEQYESPHNKGSSH